MDTKQTGGSAYPHPTIRHPTDCIPPGFIFASEGMTLRDYFAAHAPETPDMQTFPIKQWTKLEVVELGGGLKGPRDVLHQESWAERSARWAIEYADAMLAERAK